MTTDTDQHVLLRALVDELVRCGVRHACTSPGSRSAPLVLALLSDQRLRCHSHIDERASGFFALGVGKASGRPAAVACTSGTAAAELAPAVIEAYEARVPMIVLTADRPAELREVGAGQTIDQVKLYGDAAKWFFEVGTHVATPARLRWMRTLACRCYATATEGRPGVVHLNVALREPLVVDEPIPHDATGRAGGSPFLTRRAAAGAACPGELLEAVDGARRGVLIAGRHERDTPLGEAAAAFCQSRGWPLLADPLSGARRGDAAIAHYDALLRDDAFASSQRPDLVLRVGDLPPSKPLRTWLAGLGDVPQLALDPEGAWQDPDAVLSASFATEPAAALAALTDATGDAAAEPSWLQRWSGNDALAAGAIEQVLDGAGLSEPLLAAELGRALPAHATLWVASSMPVRDVETFWAARALPPRVLCNRAANGIDGTVSSALGAAATDDEPVVLLIGDVALAYDIGGLISMARLKLALTIVLINNGGGGIFDFLAVSTSPMTSDRAAYERHIATPSGLDFALAAQLAGLRHAPVTDVTGLRAQLSRALEDRSASTLIEVRTDRAENVALHRRIWSAVSEALAAARAA